MTPVSSPFAHLPPPVFSNRLSGACTSCREYVAQGEGCATPESLAAVGAAGPRPRAIWRLYCQPCARSKGLDAPDGAEHFTLRMHGAGHLEMIPRRSLSFDRADAVRVLSDAHGVRFDMATGRRLIPKERAGSFLRELGDMDLLLSVSPEALLFIQADAERAVRDAEAAEARVDSLDVLLAKRNLKLYPYQKLGVEWLAPRDRGMLCDEMGLGKTVQGLMALPSEHRAKQIKLPPVLIVCNANAKPVWKREAAIWRPEFGVTVLEGKGSFRWPVSGEMLITNYDVLPDVEDVHAMPAQDTCLLADEAHALKNKKAKRTGRFRTLGEKVRDAGGRTWIFTGTPILSKAEDLWSLAQCVGLAREAFGTWNAFKELFHCKTDKYPCKECSHINDHTKDKGCTKKGCDCEVPSIEHTVWGEPSPEVPERFARIALRRLRRDVLPELPGKTYQDHPVVLAAELKRKIEAELPEGWEESLERAIEDAGGVSFEQMSGARRALAEAKVGAMLSLVEDFEAQDEPLVVFSCHTAPLEVFAEREGWAIIDGATSTKDREEIAADFQAGKLRGLAGNIRAAGTAITLTRAAQMLFVDQAWNPGDNLQAEDRCVRIGQERGVFIHRLVADHALDVRVAELLDQKRDLIVGSLGAA